MHPSQHHTIHYTDHHKLTESLPVPDLPQTKFIEQQIFTNGWSIMLSPFPSVWGDPLVNSAKLPAVNNVEIAHTHHSYVISVDALSFSYIVLHLTGVCLVLCLLRQCPNVMKD